MNQATYIAAAAEPYVPPGMRIRHAPRLEFAAVVLWFIVIMFPMIPGGAAARYGLAGLFIASLYLFSKDLIPILQKHCIVFSLAILAMISGLWAPDGPEAMRKGVLWAMTVVVAIFIAGRLSRRQIIYIYFGMELLAGVWSAAINRHTPGGEFMIGIFDQKNVLATHMMFLFASAMALALNRHVHGWLRLLALAAMPLAVYLILGSKSATVLVFTILISLAFFVHAYIWQPFQKIPHMRALLALLFAALVSVIVLVVFGMMELDLKDKIFEALGKDSSLTGRTMLWDRAKEIMEDHPWGLGASGFWQPNVGEADALIRFFHYKQFVKFSFHNSYLEIGTQLGYLGMALAYIVAFWCGINALMNWVKVQTLDAFFFFIMAVLIIQRSFTEVDLDGEFGLTLIMLYIAAMSRHVLEPDSKAATAEAPMPVFRGATPRAR